MEKLISQLPQHLPSEIYLLLAFSGELEQRTLLKSNTTLRIKGEVTFGEFRTETTAWANFVE
jgi:hypothetical protein